MATPASPHDRRAPEMAMPQPLPRIVGIGASAGGLQALEAFFGAMPTGTGLCFVVVQHLSPTFKSLMDELLARITTMPIQSITHGLSPQPNTIYLMPARHELYLQNGAFQLAAPSPTTVVSLPIDRFFSSLAHELGDRAIGVIISSTGSDGSRGLVDIHAAGGLVIVQEPRSAQFEGMPMHALETGVVDLVLNPEQMAAALVTYGHTSREDLANIVDLEPPNTPMERIFRLLWDHHEIDFSHYKVATITRRIERRLELSEDRDIDAYVARLSSDSAVLDQLYRDLLIGVTQFFRDEEVFAYLEEEVLDDILREAERTRELRIWVAGCATGEEAYSLAMLLHEALRQRSTPISVQIFATDVHQASLDLASDGFYPAESVTHVSPPRLARYFVAEADGYRVLPILRQMIVFARHDLMRDAPFTKLDLITCRNVLIYFKPEWQQHILRLFHYGLRLGGILCLGHSESIGALADVLSEFDRSNKIYRKDYPSGLLSEAMRPTAPVRQSWPASPLPYEAVTATRTTAMRQQLYNALLEAVIPAGILVNAQGNWEHIVGDVTPFLKVLQGPNDAHILDLVHPGLSGTLRVAMWRATNERRVIIYRNVAFAETWRATGVLVPDADLQSIILRVIPLMGVPEQELALFITFEYMSHSPQPQSLEAFEDDADHLTPIKVLEQELEQTQFALQVTVEELQARTEELQTTNEELVASNEELQSSNEELQSVNEELYTVNAEYQLKNQQLVELHADSENLWRSTDIGTIFLDPHECIRKYTPAVQAAIPLQPQDIGRPLSHFTTLLDLSQDAFSELLQQVLKAHHPLTRHVQTQDGTRFLMRIHPFITPGEEVEGTVVTFVDMTEQQRTEEALQHQMVELERRNAELQTQQVALDAAIAALERSNTDLDAFISIASHDLKEPLRGIRNYAEMLRLDCAEQLDEQHQTDLETLGRLTQRLERRIDDLRAYVRIGRSSIAPELLDMEKTVAEVCEQVALLLDEQEVSIRMPKRLPVVRYHRAHLVTILQNLLANAARYNDKPDKWIEIGRQEGDGPLVFYIRDNGIGIASHLQSDAFLMFRRLHGEAFFHDGSGAGLAIVRRILDRHGGKVWLESEPGEGTTVYFALESGDDLGEPSHGCS